MNNFLKEFKDRGYYYQCTNEIELSNGTIIQGTIIYENIDLLIVETQIGQLQINKNE